MNGDGEVNIVDMSIVAVAFQTTTEDPDWNPDADLDGNGIINILDIAKVAVDFGKKCKINIYLIPLLFSVNSERAR
jgi:hypothetical protein